MKKQKGMENEMEEYLIKNTTREQREQIVKDALGYSDIGCDDCGDGFAMYEPYIEGKKELKEITMEYQTRYIKDMEREEHGGGYTGNCGMGNWGM